MKLYDFHPQNHLAARKVSIYGSAVSIAAVTVLETPTNDRYTRWVGELLRWREWLRDRLDSMHKIEEEAFPIHLVENLFRVVQKNKVAIIYILG